MAKRLKGRALVEALGSEVHQKLGGRGLFMLEVWEDLGAEGLRQTKVTDIAPVAGRAMADKMKTPGTKVDSRIIMLDANGNIEFEPAADAAQIEQDRKVAAQDKDGRIWEDKSRGVYKPGKGWIDE